MKQRKIMKMSLREQKLLRNFNFREISTDDAIPLGRLFYESYKDTIDYENESEYEFITEITKTFDGQYGPCLFDCSFVIEENLIPVAASIITLFKGVPLLAYTVTNPNYQNKGYSTFLIKKSINKLKSDGYKNLYLVVTIGNKSAMHIYKKLGFLEVDGDWDDFI